jgi:hypothetical protein
LVRDFDNLAETLAAFVTLASIQLAVRRLGRGVDRNVNKYRQMIGM